MSAVAHPPDLHPLQGVASCLDAVSAALAELPVGALPPGDPDAVAGLVAEAARVERQVRELRLRLARAAEESRAAEADASSGADAWLARLTGSTAAVMRGGLWLARQLAEGYPTVREAFAAGDLGEAHARVIVTAANEVPEFVSEVDRATAVAHLVEEAVSRRLSVAALRRRARRMLAVVDEAYADHHEAALLAKQERHAAGDTWLAMHDNGDGSWSGKFVLPDLQAHLLMTRLQHLSSPRRLSRNRAGEPVTDETVPDFPGPLVVRGVGVGVRRADREPADRRAQRPRAGGGDGRDPPGPPAAPRRSGRRPVGQRCGDQRGRGTQAGVRGRASCRWSTPAPRCRSTWGAPHGCTPRANGSPSQRCTTRVRPRGVSDRSPGPRSTTSSPGPTVAAPTSPTRSRSAAGTTTAPTTTTTTCGS